MSFVVTSSVPLLFRKSIKAKYLESIGTNVTDEKEILSRDTSRCDAQRRTETENETIDVLFATETKRGNKTAF